MSRIITAPARLSLQLIIGALLFAAPVGAFALNNVGQPNGMGKGAGFVLYVALERNAMR